MAINPLVRKQTDKLLMPRSKEEQVSAAERRKARMTSALGAKPKQAQNALRGPAIQSDVMLGAADTQNAIDAAIEANTPIPQRSILPMSDGGPINTVPTPITGRQTIASLPASAYNVDGMKFRGGLKENVRLDSPVAMQPTGYEGKRPQFKALSGGNISDQNAMLSMSDEDYVNRYKENLEAPFKRQAILDRADPRKNPAFLQKYGNPLIHGQAYDPNENMNKLTTKNASPAAIKLAMALDSRAALARQRGAKSGENDSLNRLRDAQAVQALAAANATPDRQQLQADKMREMKEKEYINLKQKILSDPTILTEEDRQHRLNSLDAWLAGDEYVMTSPAIAGEKHWYGDEPDTKATWERRKKTQPALTKS